MSRESEDRGEAVAIMEPMLLGSGYRYRGEIVDLAFELTQKAAGFRRSLPEGLIRSIADLVRSMNCYYSNLIEGHYTHPIDIERALRSDYSEDPQKRDLQLEARAHIEVQKWIDSGRLELSRTFSVEGICEIHRRFCELLPEQLLYVEEPVTRERLAIIPGELRSVDVVEGRHIAVSPGALPRFLDRFHGAYTGVGKAESVVAAAAAHHRLLWMHPFVGGNGRVARLMSHAHLLHTLGTGAVWSVARGLARNVQEYKRLLADCDQAKRNDLDGRGSLSEEALGDFTRFFLERCIDQVLFMEGLMQPDLLRTRILIWAEEEVRASVLPKRSGILLEALLYRGEIQRGEADSILGASERQARRIVAALLDSGAIVWEGGRKPLRLAFPATLATRWMPGLFPENVMRVQSRQSNGEFNRLFQAR